MKRFLITFATVLVTLVTVSAASADELNHPCGPPPTYDFAAFTQSKAASDAWNDCLRTYYSNPANTIAGQGVPTEPEPAPAPKPTPKPAPKAKHKAKHKRKHHRKHHVKHHRKVKLSAKDAVAKRLRQGNDPVDYPDISCIRITSARYECEWHGLSRLDISYGHVEGSGGSATVFFNGNRALVRLF